MPQASPMKWAIFAPLLFFSQLISATLLSSIKINIQISMSLSQKKYKWMW